jgi:hypothetical protein
MSSYSIAMTAMTMSPAIMNMASLTSTTIKEFTEKTGNIMIENAQQQQQRAITTSEEGGARNK